LDPAVRLAEETAGKALCVDIVASHPSLVVDAVRESLFGTLNIECGERTVRKPDEAVIDVIRAEVIAGDVAVIVDAGWYRRVRVRRIEDDVCFRANGNCCEAQHCANDAQGQTNWSRLERLDAHCRCLPASTCILLPRT